ANQIERTVALDRGISKAAGGVSAFTSAAESVQAEVEMLVGERPPRVCPVAAPVSRDIMSEQSIGSDICRRRTRKACGGLAAGKYAVAEPAVDAENFVVSEARFKGQLHHDIRRRIEGVVGRRSASGDGVAANGDGVVDSGAICDCAIVEAAAGAGGAYDAVGRVAVSGGRGRRVCPPH